MIRSSLPSRQCVSSSSYVDVVLDVDLDVDLGWNGSWVFNNVQYYENEAHCGRSVILV